MPYPIMIPLTTSWKNITKMLLNSFDNGDNIDFILEAYKSLEIEILIDKTGAFIVDEEQYNNGIRLDRDLIKFSSSLNRLYKYYARSIKSTTNLRISKSISQNSSAIIDSAGRGNTLGVFGEQLATDIKNDILTQFSYGKSTRDLKNEVTVTTGTVTIENDNLLTVATGTAADGQASIQSYNAIRYRPGHTIITQFTALFTNPYATDSHQWIGNLDGNDGFAIGFFDGNFAIMRVRDGVHFHTFKEDLNGDVNIDDIDFTKLNIFRITVGYLGTAPAMIEIMPEGENRYKTIHSLQLHGTLEGTHIRIPFQPIMMNVENQGNTSDCQIRSASWQGGVLGICSTCGNRPFAFPTTPGPNINLNIGTTLTPIAAFRSKSTFNGIENKIRSSLDRLHFLPYDGDGLVTVQLIAGATITGTEGVDYNFVDIDSVNSVMEISTDLTAFTGGYPGLTTHSFPTASGSKLAGETENVDGEKLGLFLDPGQVYIIAANINVGTFDVAWSVNWTELF